MYRNSIQKLHASLLRRDLTVTDICKQSLALLEETKNLNSFVTVCDKESRESAKHLDVLIRDDRAKKAKESPLFGIPVSVKDNFCTRGVLTTCSSKMLHNFVPPYDATVVEKLKKAGCIMIGKTNMDEFAMGSSSLTSYYGPTANSWLSSLRADEKPDKFNSDRWYMAGGSSSGGAVSVASGSCFASIGSDTGGSTRQPASFVGVIGFKPTYGLISRHGLIPLAHCLDVVSILARSCDDVRLIFDSIVGQDPNDLTTVDHKSYLEQKFKLPGSKEKLRVRVGVPDSFIDRAGMSSEVADHFSKIIRSLETSSGLLKGVEFEWVKLSWVHSSLSTECYTVISSAEIASNMSCYDGIRYGLSTNLDNIDKFDRNNFYKANRDAGFGEEVKKRILLGNYFLLEGNRELYFSQALKIRRLISEEFDKTFRDMGVDLILTPSTPTTSVTCDEWTRKQAENELFHQDYFLIPSNLANRPSISIPCGFSKSGLPFGIQLTADKYHDLDLLSISKLVQDYLEKLQPAAI